MLFKKRNRDNTNSDTATPSGKGIDKYGLRIVVPIQDEEQGRLAVNVLKGSNHSKFSVIRLFHCVPNLYFESSWVTPMEVIQMHDSQVENQEKAHNQLKELARELAAALPDVRITFNSIVHESVADAIADEANNLDANMILLVNDPKRKKHWLFPGVSNRILRTAKCPVQIIKPADHDGMVFVA